MAKIKIGDWTVVPPLNLLERNGETVRLEPRAMDLLVYLASASERVVSADELLKEVWQGRVFDGSIVYNKINHLRKALGDDPQQPRFIETIPKRGYRLVAPVAAAEHGAPGELKPTATADEPARRRTLVEAPPTQPVKRRWLSLASGAALAALAGPLAWDLVTHTQRQPPSIAVLPCEPLGGADDDGLALGVHEQLIEKLRNVGFEVKSRTAVMTYAQTLKPMREIASELGASALVECSVQRAERRVRVSVALADAKTGNTPWRDSYERDLADIFAIESDIARSVAVALKAKPTAGQLAALDKVQSKKPTAIEFYDSARRYQVLGVASWPTAERQYEQATREDPTFALAFAQLALLRLSMSYLWRSNAEPNLLEKTQEPAEKAITLWNAQPFRRSHRSRTSAARGRARAASEPAARGRNDERYSVL